MSTALAEDGLPHLRDVIAAHGLAAKKSLGQNFLFDLNLTRRIARAAMPFDDATIIEIGPGPGGLTRALLAEGAPKVIAIERDARALPALRDIAARYSGRLHVIEADALEVDWPGLVQGPARIVANLPYNIGTPLLLSWLTKGPWPPFYESLTLMFQKEVALRIAATPGSADYGRLSVICQWRCNCKRLFDVNRSAFTPPPKITSSIVQLVPKPNPDVACSVAALEKITQAAFGQRRKMLRASLRSVFADPEIVLESLSIAPTRRAEELAVNDFAQLAARLGA
jgi:16S rRNA (adenine1518-N6/adenine1519-N6)-dimethyltransferase